MSEDISKNFEKEVDKIIEENQIKEKEQARRRRFFNNCMECNMDFFYSVVRDSTAEILNPDVNKYWILWLDILGFKDLIEKEKYEEVFEMLSFLSHFNHEKFKSEALITSIAFSDTFINVYNPNLASFDLIFLLENIGILQSLFIFSFKNLVRGALVFDDLFFFTDAKMSIKYVSNNMYIFGKGIVEAYNLEQKIHYPIIAMDPKITQEIISCYKNSYDKELGIYRDPDYFDNIKIHFLSPSTSSMKEIMKYLFEDDFPLLRKIKNEDKEIYYIDYLSRLELEEEEGIKEFLNLHKELIETGLKEGKEGVVSKYLFLRNYHNDTVRKLIKVGFLSEHEEKFLI